MSMLRYTAESTVCAYTRRDGRAQVAPERGTPGNGRRDAGEAGTPGAEPSPWGWLRAGFLRTTEPEDYDTDRRVAPA